MNNEIIAKEAMKQGISTVVVLEGQAPTQHNNQCVNIAGTISAPSNFILGRNEDFNKSTSHHCMVSKTDGVIKLILNEQSSTDKYTITGTIKTGKKFLSLGINDDRVSYEPEELANKLKLLRAMFVSNLEHATICTTLRNLKAKINAQIESLNDRKGNVTENFKQTVSSNMPDSIKLKLPLLEGEDPIEIEVNVILETNGGSGIVCSLESVDAAELIEEQFKLRVEQEIDKIKSLVTIIEY
jgi:hypothetical protein